MEINAQECLNQNDNFACQSNIGSTLIKGVRPGVAPKFSIVIPTWKRVETLKDTVESALSQTWTGDFDVIVVEDNPELDSDVYKYLMSLTDPRIITIGMTGISDWSGILIGRSPSPTANMLSLCTTTIICFLRILLK